MALRCSSSVSGFAPQVTVAPCKAIRQRGQRRCSHFSHFFPDCRTGAVEQQQERRQMQFIREHDHDRSTAVLTAPPTALVAPLALIALGLQFWCHVCSIAASVGLRPLLLSLNLGKVIAWYLSSLGHQGVPNAITCLCLCHYRKGKVKAS